MAAITAKGLGIWDTSNGRTLRSIELRDGQHERGPYAWSGDGQWLVQGDNIGNVAVWNLRTDKEPGYFTAQRSPIKALALSHSGQVLATLGEENQLHLWNLTGWTPKNRVPTKSKTIAKPVSSD
jgi:WD40 repeat protein